MIFVDSHVHIYPTFQIAHFLDHALINFEKAANSKGNGGEADFFLLLTESAGVNVFSGLKQNAAAGKRIDHWAFHAGTAPWLLTAENTRGARLHIAAGRQIVTAERLEVLALLTEQPFTDGGSLRDTVKEVRQSGALAVIPWGMGKWFGNRGRILEQFIEQTDNSHFFLGDNGGRPFFWQRVKHFEIGRQKKIALLPGSDPLPFTGEEKRPGSYGFYLPGSLATENTGEELRRKIEQDRQQITPYGNREGFFRFMHNQIRMQFVKK